MTQYIDKAAVVAEIERRQSIVLDPLNNNIHTKRLEETYKSILSFLNTLEVKEVDLKEDIDKIWKPRFSLGWDDKSLLSISYKGFEVIAKHFFELGLKAQKGE